jgi:hypothetical protein
MDDQHFMELLLILTERSIRQRVMIQGLQEKVAALAGELEKLRANSHGDRDTEVNRK